MDAVASTNRPTGRAPRFDLVELAFVGCFFVFLGLLGGSWFADAVSVSGREAAGLAARYGPRRDSEHVEEWILRDFFQDRREGFFVDVGASDYRRFSNTYFLETELGWSGIAIDALPRFEEGYRLHRPRTRFFSFFVSERSDQTAILHVLRSHTLVSSDQRAFTERWGRGTVAVEVPTITLDDLLAGEDVDKIDLLSMDIELAEPRALAGFTLSRFRPSLVCIEAHPEVRQAILDYFAKNAYVLVGKYLRADVNNLYFTRRE